MNNELKGTVPSNEVNIKSIIASLRKNIIWMIIVPIVGACIMFAMSSYEETTYSSKVTFASINTTDSVDYIASSTQQTELSMVHNYMNILKSDTTLSRIKQNLSTKQGLAISISELRPMISVAQVNEKTAQFTATVTCDSPELAEKVAKALSEVFVPVVENIYDKDDIVKNLSKEYKAKENKPDVTRKIIIGAALGFLASFGVCFLIAYNDKTIRTEDEAKKLLGIPVIGVIPRL